MFDTHTHAVSPDVERYPRQRAAFPASWLADRPAAVDDLRAVLAEHEVHDALLVQPQGAYGFDNRYVLEAASSPGLRAVVSVDFTRPDRAQAVVGAARRGAVGVRLFSVPTPEHTWLADPATHDGWEACAAHGLVVSVCCLPVELVAAAAMARAHPEVSVVLDHCGFVDLLDDAHDPLAELVALDNIHLKVTGHLLYDIDLRGGDPTRVVTALADRVGPARMLWGSDWPQTDLGYGELAERALEATDDLGPAGRERVLEGTAVELYGRSMV